jgi:hypothetical protein
VQVNTLRLNGKINDSPRTPSGFILVNVMTPRSPTGLDSDTRVRFETGGRVSGLHPFWLVQDLGTIK